MTQGTAPGLSVVVHEYHSGQLTFRHKGKRLAMSQTMYMAHESLVLLKRVDKGRINTVKDFKADVSSVGRSSEQFLLFKTACRPV